MLYKITTLLVLLVLTSNVAAIAGIPVPPPPTVPEVDPGMLAALGSSLTFGAVAIKNKFFAKK